MWADLDPARWPATARQAEGVAEEARSVAEEASFEEKPTAYFAQTIPQVSDLQSAARIFRSTSLFGKLFGSDWRAAKKIWRSTFPGARKLEPRECAQRLLAAARWKSVVLQLEANQPAKTAAGLHWKSADTPFSSLIKVARWMRSIRNVTPHSEEGGAELRRIAFEGDSEEFTEIAQLAEEASRLNLLVAFQAAYSKKTTVRNEALQLLQRAEALLKLHSGVSAIGLRADKPINALRDAVEALSNVSAARQALDTHLAGPVAKQISAETDVERAELISTTIQFADLLVAQSVPQAIVELVLKEGCG
jgi:hypothetical protein